MRSLLIAPILRLTCLTNPVEMGLYGLKHGKKFTSNGQSRTTGPASESPAYGSETKILTVIEGSMRTKSHAIAGNMPECPVAAGEKNYLHMRSCFGQNVDHRVEPGIIGID